MKDYKLFLLTILVIVLLGLNTYWKIQDLQNPLPPINLPKFEDMQLQSIIQQNNQKKKKFVSPDEKLSFSYDYDWIATDTNYLEQVSTTELIKKYNLKPLFIARKIKMNGAFIQLIVSQGSFAPSNALKEIQIDSAESGWNMEIIQFQPEETMLSFEASYSKKGQPKLHSKEKIIFNNQENAFFIEFFTLEQDWKDFEQEINEILSSIQLSL